ncbi:hypothetical protein JCM8097_003105 [Rhodosporidiobolus ruineniae]
MVYYVCPNCGHRSDEYGASMIHYNACDVVRVRNVSSPTTSTIGGAAQGGTGAQGAQGGAGAGNGGQDGGAQGGGGGQGQQGQGGNGERKGQAGVFSEENRQ